MLYVLLNMYFSRKKKIKKFCSYTEGGSPPCGAKAYFEAMLYCARCAQDTEQVSIGALCSEHRKSLETDISEERIGHMRNDYIYPANMVIVKTGRYIST